MMFQRNVASIFWVEKHANPDTKMAASGVLLDSCLEQFNYDQAYHGVYTCNNCISLESQLKEALLEFSSSQLISKLLYKESNETTAIRRPACDVIIEKGACEESTLPTTWTKVSSKYSDDRNESVNPELQHS
jgi:hypothetical protein